MNSGIASNGHRHLTPPNQEDPSKVLVIGLDGATFDLIKPWVAEGHLSTLGRLLQEGTHGTLRSTMPPMTGPAWTSFGTGTNPGQHALYDWIARTPGSYEFKPLTALDCKVPTLYQLLSQRGRRVCALNIPMTYPPVAINGVMVSGLPAPTLESGITSPPELLQEIIDNVGDYILYPDPGQAYSDSGIDAFLDRLYRAADLRMKTLAYLRQREAWDFAMMVFNGTDTICHAMWKFMDESHPLHDPEKARKYGDAILDYYKYIDGHLETIVDTLDDDTTLLIMSDHGFGPFHKFIHVNNWLMQEGFMQSGQRLLPRLKYGLFRRGFSPMNVYNWLMRLGLGALKGEVVRGQGQGMMKRLFFSFDDVDWASTQAYSLGNVGQIYINMAGREPQGCVQPGAEYEQVRTQIMERLRALRDPETGEHVVEAVYRREELYSGDYLERAPDIVFMPLRLEYFGFGEYEFGSHQIIEAMQRGISGTHRMNGIFMAYGQAIQAGTEVENASLVDLAPTILHLMGEEVAGHMDGHILMDALTEEFIETAQQRQATAQTTLGSGYDDSGGDDGASDGASVPLLSDEEQKVLTERLRKLGYVG